MKDSVPLVSGKQPDEFSTVIADAVGGINIKVMISLFLIFMVITSDVFVTRVLANVNGATDYKHATNYGTFLQGMLLVLLFLIVDVANNYGVI